MKYIFFFITILLLANNATAQNTWSNNIACLVYSHCTSCHNTKGIGPGDFTSYTTVASYKYAIKNAVSNKTMPPYTANTNYQHYSKERQLTAQEITDIINWVDSNAPSGNLSQAPMPPTYNTNYTMVNPDAVYTIPTYTVNTTSGDLYRCFPIPSNVFTDKYISEIEIVPGNYKRVHHVLLFQDSTSVPFTLDAADPDPGYTSGGSGSNASKLIIGWTPGEGRYVFPPNFGTKLTANTNFVIQIHYPPNILNEIDSTKVLIKFATTPVRQTVSKPILNHGTNLLNGPLFIQANTTKIFVEKYTLPTASKVSLISVFPHMHKIGENIKCFAVKTNLDTIPIIDIPKWDFNWQGYYTFQKPLVIPGGSSLYAIAQYNNTTSNPFNPSNPPQNVSAGEATTEEMMLVYFNYTTYQTGDENIIIDTSSHFQHYIGCNTPSAITNSTKVDFTLKPNPVATFLYINGVHSNNYTATITNVYGQSVLYIATLANSIYCGQLAAGTYILSIKDKDNHILSNQKFVKQ